MFTILRDWIVIVINSLPIYLFNSHKLWVIKEHEDAADDRPAEKVQREAKQGQPNTPGCMAHRPQTGGASYRLPEAHQDLINTDRK